MMRSLISGLRASSFMTLLRAARAGPTASLRVSSTSGCLQAQRSEGTRMADGTRLGGVQAAALGEGGAVVVLLRAELRHAPNHRRHPPMFLIHILISDALTL